MCTPGRSIKEAPLLAVPQAPPEAPGQVKPAREPLAALSLAMLMPSLATSITNAALPTLAKEFTASFQASQWILLSYLLVITSLIVVVGRLGDLIGRRRLLLSGIAIFTVASLLCAVSPTLWLLIIARATQGLGAAIMMVLAMAFISEIVPKTKTGTAMGLLGTMSAVGTTLGPSVGGLLIEYAGWQAIFLMNIPLGGLGLGLAYRYLPADSRSVATARRAFDGTGLILLLLTLGSYSMVMTMHRGQSGPVTIALLLTALGAGAGFLLVESKSASPLVQLQLFRDPVLSAGLATTALVSTVMMTTLVVGPFYLSRALGLDALSVGLVLSAGPLSAALMGFPAGRLVDRFGPPNTTCAGLAGMIVSTLALCAVPEQLGVAGYVAPIIFLTAGYAMFQAANNTAILAAAGAEQRGLVSGMLNLSRNLGLITGASAMGALFAFGSGASEVVSADPQAIAAGLRTTFAVASILLVGALGLALAGWRKTPKGISVTSEMAAKLS